LDDRRRVEEKLETLEAGDGAVLGRAIQRSSEVGS
jgi:hypothetical protein